MTLCPAGPVLHTSVQYLITVGSRQEAASDVISSSCVRLIVPNKCVQFGDPHLKHSQEITPKAVLGNIFDSLSAITSVQK